MNKQEIDVWHDFDEGPVNYEVWVNGQRKITFTITDMHTSVQIPGGITSMSMLPDGTYIRCGKYPHEN